MRDRLGIVLCILIGSFCVYCGQSVMTGMTHGNRDLGSSSNGGPVGNAMGDTCCSPPARELPTVLFDGVVTPSPRPGSNCDAISPVFDVSAYRTVVVHTPRCKFYAQFRNGKAGFVHGVDGVCSGSDDSALGRAMTIDTRLGRELRINIASYIAPTVENPDGQAPCGNPIPLTVVAFKE
jgi:hypothetical protein